MSGGGGGGSRSGQVLSGSGWEKWTKPTSEHTREKPKHDWAPRKNLTEDQHLLFVAAEVGDVDAAKKLIAKKVNVNAQDGYLQTALYYAAWKGQPDVAALLVEVAGLEIDAQDKYKSTPLHYACACGHKQIAEMLIAKGANVNHADKRGKTAHDYAKMHKQFHITKMLEPLMKQDSTRKMQMLTLDDEDEEEPRSSEQVPGLAGSDADLR